MYRLIKKYGGIAYLLLAIVFLPLAPAHASNSLLDNYCAPPSTTKALGINVHCPLCLNLDQPFLNDYPDHQTILTYQWERVSYPSNQILAQHCPPDTFYHARAPPLVHQPYAF